MMRWRRVEDLPQAKGYETPKAGRPKQGYKEPQKQPRKRKESWRKQRTKEKKTKNWRENRSQPQVAQTDPVQRMGWAQTDLIEKGKVGDGGSRQEMKPNPALDPTQRRKTAAGGAVGEESGKREPGLG
jgi:hypothetical protein